jgi:hypothetical protein
MRDQFKFRRGLIIFAAVVMVWLGAFLLWGLGTSLIVVGIAILVNELTRELACWLEDLP